MSCDNCKGEGFLVIFNSKTEHMEIQKCDGCNWFKDDREAWKYLEPK